MKIIFICSVKQENKGNNNPIDISNALALN